MKAALCLFFVLACACTDATEHPDASIDASTDAPAPEPKQTASVTATVESTRFVTREHFLASAEMQISGEPLAETMGRDLAGYSRDHLPTNLYYDPASPDGGSSIDLPGFASAVESYEYSKQPMNQVAFESGAGTSLMYGPTVNETNASGAQATAQLAALVQKYAAESHADGLFVFPAGTFPANPNALLGVRGSGDPNPKGIGTGAENPLGWPGIWPTTHVFRSFDPTIDPTSNIDLLCAISSDDDPGTTGALACADYECSYTTLHLANRASQIEATVSPGADGFSAWKYGLWVLNYLEVMHDETEAGVDSVPESELAQVGQPGSKTFIGSSNIEGFQAQMFIAEIDDRAEDWLLHLATNDGATLSGFASIKDALSYAYDSPLRWFPSAISVTESDDGSGFPKPAYALSSSSSSLLDWAGLVLGYSTFYALTDTKNTNVGGAQSARCVFDGDPFPADDQLADGEATLHDRALAMMRVAIVDLDRLHADPSGVLVDDVTFQGATPQRGSTVATTSLAYSILALRTALRALGSQLELYSNNTPDTALATTPLDVLPTNAPSGQSFSARTKSLLRAQGDLLFDHLTDSSGRAFDGWSVQTSSVIGAGDSLDAHTAAVRGLFAMFLATGDVKYRARAMAVYDRIEATFYDASARIYGAAPAPVDTVDYTPMRFALLQSTLRDVYELVASRPGGESLAPTLERRVARLNKLILNGWDDRNEDQLIDWPGECVNVVSSLPRGGLQMAERTLTGETGSFEEQLGLGSPRTPTSDREKDCVPEIDDAKLPAALAEKVTFHVVRP